MKPPRDPITAGALRDGEGRLLLGCYCGWQRYADLASIPAELIDRTIQELQMRGRWRCPRCGQPAVAMVYEITTGTLHTQTERWAHGTARG